MFLNIIGANQPEAQIRFSELAATLAGKKIKKIENKLVHALKVMFH